MTEIEWDWKVGPVTLGGEGVLAQYADNNRWNGWLNPWLDPWGVERLFETFFVEQDPDYAVTHEWLDDGSLKITEQNGDEAYPDVIEPTEDGLYPIGYYGWCWYEDDEYGATDEWKAWSHALSEVSVAANNAKNQEQIDAGIMDRRRANEAASRAAVEEWVKAHPEPPKYPTKEDA